MYHAILLQKKPFPLQMFHIISEVPIREMGVFTFIWCLQDIFIYLFTV